MRRFMIAVTASTLATATAATAAENWAQAYAIDMGTGYVDLASVTSQSSLRTFREKVLLAEALDNGAKSLVNDDLIDCGAKTLQITHYRLYDAAGKLTAEWPSNEEARPIKDGTTADKLRQMVC